MASNPLTPIGTGFDLTTSFKTIYTPSLGALRGGVDAIVFNNYSSTTTTVTIRISQSSSDDIFDEIITEKKIRAKDNFLAPGLIGQAVLFGGTIKAKVSADGRISGKLTVTEVLN